MDVKTQGRLCLAVTTACAQAWECESAAKCGRYYTRQECGESMYYAVIKGACK
ncbi:hypothetical protein X777_09562 [Ooceraea biroi]|uniref:Uncharacterized protein n=1 Tax=Ooceraea biroi TaxID=2015173 RepID=A0A026W6X0_OOCBI|nr:hypothetical protein X777_09562 [Ooceraea biroi]